MTVTVSDNGDGTLHVDAVYPDQEESVNFENTYKPDPIYYTPAVTKTVTGNALSADQIFSFELAKGTFTPDDGAQMPSDTEARIKVEKGATTGTVTDNFGRSPLRKPEPTPLRSPRMIHSKQDLKIMTRASGR